MLWILLALLPLAARAQEPADTPTTEATAPAEVVPAAVAAPPVDDKALAELRERLRTLEQRLDAQVEKPGDQQQFAEVPLDLDTVIHGYGSVNSRLTNEAAEHGGDNAPGVSLSELIFTYSANLDRRYQMYTELAYEPEEAGALIDIEVFQLQMQLSDAFGLVAGRVHAPWSYWANTSFHGEYRYTPIATPEILAPEEDGGWMPIHQVGVWAQGRIPIGFWLLDYNIGVSNGRSEVLGGVAQKGDNALDKAVMGHLWLQSPDGLLIGVSGYHDRVSKEEASGAVLEGDNATIPYNIDENILSTQVIYDGPRLEVYAEGFAILHKRVGRGELVTNYGGYVVTGYSIKHTTPYVLASLVLPKDNDPLYRLYGEYEGIRKVGLGVRQELGLRLALKLEGNLHQETVFEVEGDGPASSSLINKGGVNMQLAAGF